MGKLVRPPATAFGMTSRVSFPAHAHALILWHALDTPLGMSGTGWP